MLGIRQARTGSCRLLGADMSGGGSSGAPCGACKFLRRKCVKGCIFAPYFGSEQGAARFAAVHKIFGASNVSKLLLQIPSLKQRCDAVLTISYEAQARLSDPVYGCVATIFALQQQVAGLQTELAIVQAQLASRLAAIQQQQQHSLSASAASMYDISSLGASSSTNKEDYLQVQAAAAGGLHNFDLGVPIQQSMESSTHKSCKGRMSQDAEELQALLCRK